MLYRGKVFVMGGEGWQRVHGQNEAWDPATDRWEQYAPMLTPRHGMGAVVVGDAIDVDGYRRAAVATAVLLVIGGAVSWIGIRNPAPPDGEADQPASTEVASSEDRPRS